MFLRLIALIIGCSILTGCADVNIPKTSEMFRQPTGTGGLSLGMSRVQVVERYGEPDIKSRVFSSEWRGEREEWIYRGRYSALPVGAGYLSNDLYLYFDGDSLTHISKNPLGSVDDDETDAHTIK